MKEIIIIVLLVALSAVAFPFLLRTRGPLVAFGVVGIAILFAATVAWRMYPIQDKSPAPQDCVERMSAKLIDALAFLVTFVVAFFLLLVPIRGLFGIVCEYGNVDRPAWVLWTVSACFAALLATILAAVRKIISSSLRRFRETIYNSTGW